MGFFDCRCAITGVSLKGAKAVLLPLQVRDTGHYFPVMLAIKGDYNRLGAIDGIEQDINTERILAFFLQELDIGNFVVDREYLADCRPPLYPLQSIDHLVGAFERNINDHPEAALWKGEPIVFALIARAVWDALTKDAKPSSRSEKCEVLFQRIFDGAPLLPAVYPENLRPFAAHLAELSAVADFVTERGIVWRPADDGSQHDEEEMREFLTEARATFAGSPVVLAGLDVYEREVQDLLE